MSGFDLQKITEHLSCSIFDAIQNLNESRCGIVLICDEGLKLVGTVTDADIRSGLANGLEISESILKITNRNPVIADISSTFEQMDRLFKDTQLRAIPKIDEKGILRECAFIDSYGKIQKFPKVMLIMAGGFGTRMGRLTENIPKPMLEIKGRPMVEHVLRSAVSEDFKDIFISTHYLSDKICQYFGDGAEFGASISYINEERPLGTIGSFGELPVSAGPILVTNADVLTNVGYSKLVDFHVYNSADITLAVHSHIIEHPFGVVKSNGIEFLGIEEKPKWTTSVNAGIYVINAEIKNIIEKNESISIPNFLSRAVRHNKRIITFPLHEEWVDLGSKADYFEHRD